MKGSNIEKIVIGKKISKDQLSRIRERISDASIVEVDSEEDQERELDDADILFTRILPKNIQKASGLKWVQFMWEGIDTIGEELRDSDVLLTNAGGAHSIQIAEHVFAFLLNLSRKNRMYIGFQNRREWLGWFDQPVLDRLYGSTIGIIGYGRLGRAIATIARGFNMKVIALKRDPEKKKNSKNHEGPCCDIDGTIPEEVLGPDDMDRLIQVSDHVVMTLPLTRETEGMFGVEQFRRMKRSAFFINVGRGRVVDEASLIEALEKGEIAGAGLDVFEEEPLAEESPLWDMENVLITPHASVGGDPAEEQVVDIFLENLERFMKGERLMNLIDKKKGY